MIDIIVQRGDGDRPGPDIVEPLLATTAAALARGAAEMDSGALADEVQLTVAVTDYRPGELVRVEDPELGNWLGKITAVRHQYAVDDAGNVSAETTITIRRPR